MALNFTVSYTFSPSTTIASAQVNTNTNDVAAVFQGLEAKTKSLSNLLVDTAPATSTAVAIKSYVDSLMVWRRPNLQFATVTTVAVEAGNDGTSGDIPMLFPDGSYRTETSTTRTTFNITRNAVLTSASGQSGLTGATSEANNTWYALYAVKVTDSSTQWVTIGSTVTPIQANFATLNTAYGTNGWVYLGMIRNGDGGSTAGDILAFQQAGPYTLYQNVTTGTNYGGVGPQGMVLATSASATTTTWTSATGTAGAVVPTHTPILLVLGARNTPGADQAFTIADDSSARLYYTDTAVSRVLQHAWVPASKGVRVISATTAVGEDIILAGYFDGVLGAGSNPLL